MSQQIVRPERAWLIGPNATLPEPTPREIWESKCAERDRMLEQQRSIKERLRALEEPLRDAKYDAVTAIACPYCAAPVGEPCQYPAPFSYSPHYFHGVRESASIYVKEDPS